MVKIRVEVCLISARGLRRSSSLWKLQWFVVGWIDPSHKYCSKIDDSGSSNPTWRTKFSVVLDDSDGNFQSSSLNVEVYRREPIFLREKLHGTATVQLKEFLAKRGEREEVGSFQLRRRRSERPQGFVDVSVRISEERGGASSYSAGNEEGGFRAPDDHKMGLSIQQDHGIFLPPTIINPSPNFPYTNPISFPAVNHSNPQLPRPPRTPPPPPPPSHVGFVPTFLSPAGPLPQSYINLPSSSSNAGGRIGGSGLGMGVGAGALAAGAVIFGDDFMSEFDYPMGFQSGSLTVSMDPPF